MLSESVDESPPHDTLPGMCRDCTNINQYQEENVDHEIQVEVYGFNKKSTIYVTSEAPFYFPMNTPLNMATLSFPGKTV